MNWKKKYRAPVHDHVFRDIAQIYNSDVYVLQCPSCNDVTVMWGKTDISVMILDGDVSEYDLLPYTYSADNPVVCRSCGYFGKEKSFIREIHRNVESRISECKNCRFRETVWYRTAETEDVNIKELK